jgi:hypothetical protein
VPTPPPQPQGCTPTSQAELKIETEYFETSTSKGTVITTATKTATSSFPILGCEDVEATRSTDVCSAPTQFVARAVDWLAASATPVADEVEGQPVTEIEVPQVTPAVAAAQDTPDVRQVPGKSANGRASFVHRNRRRGDCQIVIEDLYVYPAKPKDKASVGEIRRALDDLRDLFEDLESYIEIKSDTLGFTAFFYVYNADLTVVMNSMTALGNDVVSRICALRPQHYLLHELTAIHVTQVKGYYGTPHKVKKPVKRASHGSKEDLLEHTTHNDTEGLFERAMTNGVETPSWALSFLGVPPKVNFMAGKPDNPGDYAKRALRDGKRQLGPFNYYADPSSCQGTFIYIVDFAVEWGNQVRRSRSIPQLPLVSTA